MTPWPDLVLAYLENSLSIEQQAELSERLSGDEAARDDFAMQCFLDHELSEATASLRLRDAMGPDAMGPLVDRCDHDAEHNGPQDAEIATQVSASHLRSRSLTGWASRHPMRTALAVAATVLVAVLVSMALTPLGNPIAVDGGKGARPEFVARLTDWRNDVWLEDTRPPLDDARLKPGQRLLLASGFVEIQYETGVRVVVEGPAEFVVGQSGKRILESGETVRISSNQLLTFDPQSAANSGFLRFGKLVARVHDRQAQGFFVDTPAARVTDLGTEFGLEVLKTGETRLEVFDGSVQIAPAPGNHNVGLIQPRELKAGEHLELDRKQGLVQTVRRESTHFQRAMPPVTLAHLGDDPVRRGVYDSAAGVLFVRNEPADRSGKAHSVSFYSERKDYWMTPVLLAMDKERGNFRITGCGQSIRTRGVGVQAQRFRLVSGSDAVEKGVHVFGFFDGEIATDMRDAVSVVRVNAGALCHAAAGNWMYCINAPNQRAPRVGKVLTQIPVDARKVDGLFISKPGRTYSMQLTIAVDDEVSEDEAVENEVAEAESLEKQFDDALK